MHGHLKKTDALICNISCNVVKIKQVKNLKYLGHAIS